MRNIIKAAAIASMLAASASASAWWGGPFSSWSDEFFGDGTGDFDFNMSANANSRAWGRGYGYDRYYAGPYAYGPYGYPYGAPVAPQAPVATAEAK